MSEDWQYQVRANVRPDYAEHARNGCDHRDLAELSEILAKHDTQLKCQYDAFADYVAQAEAEGINAYPLYAWTKSTIEDPAKKEKYLKNFTFYVGGREVYPKAETDALVADIEPLVGGPIISDMKVYDTNPANNPQPPKQASSNQSAG